MRFAILVVWNDGVPEYLKEGLSPTQIALFPSRGRAQAQADFLREGMEGEVQSINVVRAPVPRKRRASATNAAAVDPVQATSVELTPRDSSLSSSENTDRLAAKGTV